MLPQITVVDHDASADHASKVACSAVMIVTTLPEVSR
jgi:hypothetical protein